MSTHATSNSSSSSYTSLQGDEHHGIYEVKKSKFITWAWPIATPEDALRNIEQRKDPSASHNCYAFKCGTVYRSSDDGEPGGTAGRPILAAIDAEGLDYVCVLVTRHFGGIKLGTGGLVRAYGAAAREVLKMAPKREVQAAVTALVKAPYELLGPIYQALQAQGAQRIDESYGEGVSNNNGVVITIVVEQGKVDALERGLRDVTSGKVGLSVQS